MRRCAMAEKPNAHHVANFSRRDFLTTAAAGFGGWMIAPSAPASARPRAEIVQTDFSKLPPYGNGPLPAGIRSRHIATPNVMPVPTTQAGYDSPGRPAT